MVCKIFFLNENSINLIIKIDLFRFFLLERDIDSIKYIIYKLLFN